MGVGVRVVVVVGVVVVGGAWWVVGGGWHGALVVLVEIRVVLGGEVVLQDSLT